MTFEPTTLAGAWVVRPDRFDDERGFFARTFCRNEFEAHGLNPFVAQCNTSHNRSRGTLRGMHWQAEPHQEAKLVHCVRGALFDVIIDLRRDSNTYKQHFGLELTAGNGTMLYIPEGCAHGFLTLVDDTDIFYQMSAFYAPGFGRGVRYDDPTFGIDWPGEVRVIAERDRTYPDFQD